MKYIVLAALLALPLAGLSQACSTTSPCVQLPISNPNTLPASTVVWSCMGDAASCSQTALTTAISAQTVSTLCPVTSSVWHCKSFSQTKTPQLYNDPEPWGALMNYSTQGATTGGVSASSPILIFQVPTPSAQQTSIPGVPTMVTSGNAGPQ